MLHDLIPWSKVLLEQQTICELVLAFIENKISLLCSYELATGFSCKVHEFSTFPHR
jgi:hypothetical protein